MSTLDELFKSLPPTEKERVMGAVFAQKYGAADPPTGPASYVDLAAFLARPRPPLEFLVEGLLARGRLALLSGRPKSGKSWLLLQLAMAVDNGRPFLGRATQPGRVLYVPLEDGEDLVHRRCHDIGWTIHNGSQARFGLPPFNGPSGDLGPGLAEVAAAAAEFDLVIIDTLAATLTGRANENDNAAMGAILQELARIAHGGRCTLLVVHHTNKGSADEDRFTGVRGASAIRAAYDVGMLLEVRAGEPEGVLRIESRDAEVEGLTIRRVSGGVGWEAVGGLGELTRIRAGRRVVEALAELGDGQTVEELAEYLGVSKPAARQQLWRAERDGLVMRSGSVEGNGRPADLWSLKAQGENLLSNAMSAGGDPENGLLKLPYITEVDDRED